MKSIISLLKPPEQAPNISSNFDVNLELFTIKSSHLNCVRINLGILSSNFSYSTLKVIKICTYSSLAYSGICSKRIAVKFV